MLGALDERATISTCCAVHDKLCVKVKFESVFRVAHWPGFCPRIRAAATKKIDMGFVGPKNSKIELYKKANFGDSRILMFFRSRIRLYNGLTLF